LNDRRSAIAASHECVDPSRPDFDQAKLSRNEETIQEDENGGRQEFPKDGRVLHAEPA
jgi:hypothetical protein